MDRGVSVVAKWTHATIIGWRWRSPLRRSGPRVRRRFTTPALRPCRIPSFCRARVTAGVKADKLYLVGFMGAGKHGGRAMGRATGWRVEDIDERIEARERRSIASIFAQHGEAYFRQLERQALGELLPERHVVVATGGGTFAEADNRAWMLADGAVVWLDLPLPASSSACRPTAATARRRPCAAGAVVRDDSWRMPTHLRVDATQPVAEVVEHLLAWIEHDAISGPQRHSRQSRGAGIDAVRGRRGGMPCWCSVISSATVPIQTP